MTMMLIDSENFRGHCASALTHPVTVAAVVVLLLNDGLFKSLWPDSWVTGKLSDLAWVVFASPLLAFVLSLFLCRRLFGRRATIIIAYVGLPVLYAAFNTFTPVHDRILWGLSLVAGGTAGSPLDHTDSLVIPVGLGIAVWVWRRRAVDPGRLRVRLALLAAGVATFASVATSYTLPVTGIRSIGVAGDGAIMAAADDDVDRLQYSSRDGGFTWEPYSWPPNIVWGGEYIETPRGVFLIHDTDILVFTVDGDWVPVYSAAYLQEDANVWVQEQSTTQFVRKEIGTRPYSITYDERSGNLIAAMGLQGVVVGSPDGRWSHVAVGDYSPTDFSLRGKGLVLISNFNFWLIAFVLSLSMTEIALALALFRSDIAVFGVISAMVSGGLLLRFGQPEAPITTFSVISYEAIVLTVAILLAYLVMRASWRQLRQWPAILVAFAGMNGLVILVFLLWVHLGFGLTFAKISAFTLVALVAIALTAHLKRRQQPG